MKKFALIFTVYLLCMMPLFQTSAAVMSDGHNAYSQIAGNTPILSVLPGGLRIEVLSDSNESFTIYSITGQMVKSITISNGAETIDLPQGCYIVKCSYWSKKIIVK